MERLLGRLIALIEWWAVFLLVALTAVVCLGVFFRYVLNDSLVWYDEFASYLLVWLTFYGAVVAHYHQRHINFDLMVEKLAPLPRRVADVVAELAVLGFQFVLFYYGWILTERLGDESTISLPWFRIVWVNSVMPITGALMLIVSVWRLFDLLTRPIKTKGGHVSWSGSSSE
jgi:TRAP-type C4-dicarboxylate transport system permease small subunit